MTSPNLSLINSGKKIPITLYELADRIIYIEPEIKFHLVQKRYDRDLEDFVIEDRRKYNLVYGVDNNYPTASREKVLMWARQMEKTTTIAILGALLMMVYPGYRILYIEPTGDQMNVLSTTRFKVIAESSPFLKNNYLKNINSRQDSWQVRQRTFSNKSIAYFRSCFETADRIRGITAYGLFIDEIQDILPKNIPIIESCQDHAPSDIKFKYFSGTPKSKQNVLFRLYDQTCQWEWLVKCFACNHWNFLDEKIIGKYFYICSKCGKQIYPNLHEHGHWVPLYPSRLTERFGMRLPQMLSPIKTHADLKAAMENKLRPWSAFLNENLALPSDESTAVLTESEIRRTCGEHNFCTPEQIKEKFGNIDLYGGIDHGTGEVESSKSGSMIFKSFTVVTIAGYLNQKWVIFYIEKLVGEKARLANQPDYFDKLFRLYNVKAVGSDWGFGATTNDLLRKKYGWRSQELMGGTGPVLLEFQSITARARIEVAYVPKASHFLGRYIINKNWLVDTMINNIRAELIVFPNENIMFNAPFKESTFASDYLGMFFEYDSQKNVRQFNSMGPDDTVMSNAYAILCGMQFMGKLSVSALPQFNDQTPMQEARDPLLKDLAKELYMTMDNQSFGDLQ